MSGVGKNQGKYPQKDRQWTELLKLPTGEIPTIVGEALHWTIVVFLY
jgi:hypothetical protein